jgi:hypothetical protein
MLPKNVLRSMRANIITRGGCRKLPRGWRIPGRNENAKPGATARAAGIAAAFREGAKGMTTLTEQDIQRNMRAVAHAIAQQELEGLTVPASTVADLNRAARGEIDTDTDEVIRNIYCRVQNVSLLRQ